MPKEPLNTKMWFLTLPDFTSRLIQLCNVTDIQKYVWQIEKEIDKHDCEMEARFREMQDSIS